MALPAGRVVASREHDEPVLLAPSRSTLSDRLARTLPVSAFAVRGWCPDAWRPMLAGDGLLVRVRPRLGRLTREQALGLCAAALAYGNGAIDLTSRGNLQLRGITEPRWQGLIDQLIALDLIDADPGLEARTAILVAPDWRAGDDTQRIAAALLARRGDWPDLPGKIGVTIDAGPAPVLLADPGDFRIERGMSGGLILRADGHAEGVALAAGTEVEQLIALAQWYVASGGREAGRMARHCAPLPGWATPGQAPAAAAAAWQPGRHPLGSVLGAPFGRVDAAALAACLEASAATALRITPWRLLILEGAAIDTAPGLVTDPHAPAITADACVGAPSCPQGSVATRDLALRLAPHIDGRLHVSGCAKGCARSRPADVVLVGRDGRFDLVLAGRAGDPPSRTGLAADQLLALFGTR
jgi:precorrin-3B synthase